LAAIKFDLVAPNVILSSVVKPLFTNAGSYAMAMSFYVSVCLFVGVVSCGICKVVPCVVAVAAIEAFSYRL